MIKLFFLVIITIIFYIFIACAKLTAKAADFVVGEKRPNVTKRYEDDLHIYINLYYSDKTLNQILDNCIDIAEEMINGNVINMELAGFVGKNIFIFEMISAVTSISLFTFPLIYQEKLANGHCFRDNINKSISDKITTSCLLGMSLLTVDKISSFYPLNEERLKQEWYMRNTIYMKKLGENLDKYLNKNDKFVPTAITKLTIHKTLETATYICSELISEINEKEYTKYISYLTTKCLQIAERLYELNRYLERNA